MAGKIGWCFPDSPASFDGFNDGDMEHFKGNPLGSLAREVIQNSLDASTGMPVRVTFALGSIAPGDIPDIAQLRRVVSLCGKLAPEESPAAVDFFAAAQALLEGRKIQVLHVHDENTTGIIGPCIYGTKYFAYMKAKGQSRKSSEDDLGSFGIGKSAPLAVSQLRTVMVSTVYRSDNGKQVFQYTQGKARLMGHFTTADRSDTKSGTGYWGQVQGCLPVEGFDHAPKWLQRAASAAKSTSRVGTTLHILAFRAISHWEDILTAYVIENFFRAILAGRLVVTIEGKQITASNIGTLFTTARLRTSVADLKDEPDRFDYASAFYHARANAAGVVTHTQENRELGKCTIDVVVKPGMPKRVAVLRHGMFITDQLDKLKRFADFKDFAAVVECHNKKGNELLRRMEPPKHNDFEPERLSTEADKQKGQRALKELAQWVRTILEREARNPVTAVTDIDELANYFPDEGEQSDTKEKEDVNPVGQLVITAARSTRTPTVITVADRDADNDDDVTPKPTAKQVLLDNVRVISKDDSEKTVSFTPRQAGRIKVSLYEAGADSDRRLFVEKVLVGGGAASKGRIVKLKVGGGIRVTVQVKLRNRCNGAIKVVAYAV